MGGFEPPLTALFSQPSYFYEESLPLPPVDIISRRRCTIPCHISKNQNILHFTIVWLALTSLGYHPKRVLQMFYFNFLMNLIFIYNKLSKIFSDLLHYFNESLMISITLFFSISLYVFHSAQRILIISSHPFEERF